MTMRWLGWSTKMDGTKRNLAFLLWSFLILQCATSFHVALNQPMPRHTYLMALHKNENPTEELFLERFRRRRMEMEVKLQKEDERRPPNANLSAEETVREVLIGLQCPHYPQRYFGIEVLLRTCTTPWRTFLCQSVAATADEDDTAVAAALEAAMSRPHNQFRILLGLENEGYEMDFPTDALDYGDGTCWIECRLRASSDDSVEPHALLVALGWSLVRDRKSGAWVIDGLDWQDFRDAYRPGIGREEWERICG